MKVSIFELVVGDIVQLNIGDQVSIIDVFLIYNLSDHARNLTNFLAALLFDSDHIRLNRADG